MSVRLLSYVVCGLSVALFVTVGCSWGQGSGERGVQQPPATSPEPASLDELFGSDDPEPQAEPTEITDANGVDDREGPAMPEQPLAEAAADPRDAEIQQLRSRLAAMETEIESLKATVQALDRQLVNTLDPEQLSRRALGAMAQDPQMLSGLGQMLQGKVRLVNDTGEPQVVYINGTPWSVVTGRSFVYAPVGTVSFLREGEPEPLFKGIQEWTENEATGQFEVEYHVPEPGRASTETSVLRQMSN